jgi:hypothetical protein
VGSLVHSKAITTGWAWNNVCGFWQDENGLLYVGFIDGNTLVSQDPPPQLAEIAVVFQPAANGQSTLSLYYDSALEATITATMQPAKSPGSVVIMNAVMSLLRVFTNAMDPAKDDLFWFDEPSAPFPSSLAAAYDFYTLPAIEKVSGATLPNVNASAQTIIAGGRFWQSANGDAPSVVGFTPGQGTSGFTVQAWVYSTSDLHSPFILTRISGKWVLTIALMAGGAMRIGIDTLFTETFQTGASPGTWMNFAVTCDQGVIKVYLNGSCIREIDYSPPFGDFGPTTTQIGGWEGAPGPAASSVAIQAISYFSSALSQADIQTYVVTPPTGDPRCIGFFFAFDGNSPVNMITGEPTVGAPDAAFQNLWGAASTYVYPPPSNRRSRRALPPPARPLARPRFDDVRDLVEQAIQNLGLAAGSAEAIKAAAHLLDGLRVTPDGNLVRVGEVLARSDGYVIRFDLVTADGLVQVEGLAVAVGDDCAAWMARFISTGLLGILNAITMWPVAQEQLTEYILSVLRDNTTVQRLRAWIGAQGGGDVDYQQYLAFLKVLWRGGNISVALWECYESLDWFDRGRAVITMGLTVSAIFVPASPPQWVWLSRLAAQLTLTFMTLQSELKQRPAGCPSAETAVLGLMDA